MEKFPVKINHVKITELSFDPKHNKELDKLLKIMNKHNIDGMALLPSKPQHKVEFSLIGYSALANAIRRCLVDEIPTWHLTFDDETITITDDFMPIDHLKKNINLLPIDQHIQNVEDYKISLNKLNTTDEPISLYNYDIDIIFKGKPLPSEKFFSAKIPLMTALKPQKQVYIKSFKIEREIGINNGAKGTLLSNVSYKITDMNLYDEESKNGQKSLATNPTSFIISYTTNRNIKPLYVMELCIDTLVNRLNKLMNNLESYLTHDKTYISSSINIEEKNELIYYSFEGEYYTLINLIAFNCYIIDPNIPMVTPCVPHPSKNNGVIKIKHVNHQTILLNAIKKSIEDLVYVRKAFIKKKN